MQAEFKMVSNRTRMEGEDIVWPLEPSVDEDELDNVLVTPEVLILRWPMKRGVGYLSLTSG